MTAVDDYISDLEHPFKPQLETVRRIVLGASPLVEERIKWRSPSFHVAGTDLGAFELRPTAFLRLILVFPHGLVANEGDWMLGAWPDRRELRFVSADDVAAKRPLLEQVVRSWVALLPAPRR
jgi:hypothetical protein